MIFSIDSGKKLFIYLFIYLCIYYEIYCQIGFHTTPSIHPNRCPPQCPSPTLPSLTPPHQPSVYSQFLRVSYGLPPTLSNFFPPPPPHKDLRIHIRVETYGIYLSLYDLFHLA